MRTSPDFLTSHLAVREIMFGDVEAAAVLEGRVVLDERGPVREHDFWCQLSKLSLHTDSDGREVGRKYGATNVCVETWARINSAAGEPDSAPAFPDEAEESH
jgi:hypothetical protein